MATTAFKGTPVHTTGELPSVGSKAPDFSLVGADLSDVTLSGLKGRRVVLNIFPSVDTGVCAMQTKKFNDQLSAMADKVNAVTISLDLPFAMNRFCGAESIKNMRVGSDYQDRNFGNNWGTLIEELKIECRAVFVVDANGKVTHAEYVGEVTNEPDYHAAMEALQSAL